MPGGSSYVRNAVLNWIRGTAFPAAPVTGYVALYTSPTGPDAEGTEATGGGYARVAVTSATGWAAIAAEPGTLTRYVVNTGTVTFPTATASWGTVTHWAYYSAATAGNRLLSGELPAPEQVETGDVLSWAAGQLRAEMAP